MADSKLTVGYWGIQGLAHPARLLLSYFKTPFEDRQYTEREEWFVKEKPTLNTPLPSLPYIKDGDTVITESFAVIQYAALKSGHKDLLGKNEHDQILAVQLWSVARDLAQTFVPLVWDPEFETKKDETLKTKTVPVLEKISKLLGEKEYPLGYITFGDFNLAFALDALRRLSPGLVSAHPNLEKYHERIYSNEGIQAYRKSEKYPKLFMPPSAKWTGEEKI